VSGSNNGILTFLNGNAMNYTMNEVLQIDRLLAHCCKMIHTHTHTHTFIANWQRQWTAVVFWNSNINGYMWQSRSDRKIEE